jgi:hypothetical protein
MYRVGEEQVASEHPEPVEVDDRSHADSIKVALWISTMRGDVHCHPNPTLPRKIRRPAHESVGHEVVSDQRHPTLDEAARREEVKHLTLELEHLISRGGMGSIIDIPPPTPHPSAEPERPECPCDSVDVGNRAGFDDGGHAVQHRLGCAERGG